MDTCCLGPNFVPLYYMGKVYNVSSFLQDLPNQEAISICTGATAYDDNFGQTHILIVNMALWFGDRLEASLINPNQIRAHGIQLCDDPTDPNRDLGLQINHLFLPFIMEGITCTFTLRTPTEWELDNCPHLEVTSDTKWLPKAAHFAQDNGKSGEDDQPPTVTAILAYNTRHRHSNINSETLARQWGIGIETARKTLRVTTQAGIRHAIHPLHRQY